MAIPFNWGAIAEAGGTTFNNRINQIMSAYQLAQSFGDTAKMQQYIDELRRIPNLDPKTLQYVAETIGVQPDVLASDQRRDQIGALKQLQDIAGKGGMDEAAIAANQQASMAAARANQADNQAITGSLARRGLNAGSGAELSMRQNAAQTAYNTRAMEGAANAQAAQMRALNAIRDSGRLAGDLASEEEARMAANAERRSATDRFNAGVKNAAAQYNAGANLDAAQYNLGLAGAKIAPGQAAKEGLRREQSGYVQDIGNREQMEGENLNAFGGDFFGGKGKKR